MTWTKKMIFSAGLPGRGISRIKEGQMEAFPVQGQFNLFYENPILKIFLMILGIAALTAAAFGAAHAKESYTTSFNSTYGTDGTKNGTTLGSCITCHLTPDGKGNENPYGLHYKAYGHNFAAVEPLDSDGDGFSNIDEIIADTWPGDATSKPGPAQQPPVANAGGNQAIDEGKPVTLNGSGSYDPDGFIVSYVWSQSTGIPVTLSNPSAAQTTFTAPLLGSTDGVLSFTLTVTDNSGLTSSATATVTVMWVNEAPIADAGNAQTVAEGIQVTLDGSNSRDPDGNIVSYQWVQTTGPTVSLSDPAAVKPSFTSPTIVSTGAALTFDLTVTDSLGLKSTDTAIVNVTNGNLPPVANAGGNRTVNEGIQVTLNGSASNDPDGTIVSFQWVQVGGPAVSLANAASATPAFTAPNVGPNGAALTFRLTVIDDGGLQAVDTSIVNVSWVNQPPTADAGSDQIGAYGIEEGNTVAMDGSGSSDPDDGIAAYLWEQTGAGPSVTLSDPTSVRPTFVTPVVDATGANLTFRLTVTDKGGLQATTQVAVEVYDNGIAGFPDGVLTTNSFSGSPIGIAADSGGSITNFQTVDPATLPAVAEQPDNLIIGLVDLQINTSAPGGTAKVTIYLSEPAPPDYKWYKFNPSTNTWADYSNSIVNGVSGAVFNAARDQVTLTLVDGGLGDDRATVDSKIQDPSGLGTGSVSPASVSVKGSNYFGSGAGGTSCFVELSRDGSWTVFSGPMIWIVALGLLLLISAGGRYRRKRSARHRL